MILFHQEVMQLQHLIPWSVILLIIKHGAKANHQVVQYKKK